MEDALPPSQETLASLYREFSPFVLRLARGMGLPPEEAEDAVHDVFIRVFEDLPSFRGASGIKTWIYRITVNHCLNRRRRRRPLPWSLLGREAHPAAPEAHENPGVLRLLDELSPKLRTAVVLKDIEGLSYEEMAQALEISPGTAMSRVARGREELRVLFAKSTEENG